MYARVKSELKDIVELVESVPDRYRDKCFELLLGQLLAEDSESESGKQERVDNEQPVGKSADTRKFPVPAKVRAFIQRHGLSEDELRKLVLVENGEVHFIHEPSDVKVATGQIQWALLLALKSSLLRNELSVDAEDVRSICIEKGLYDATNFASNFKVARNKELFQKVPQPQGEAVKLSSKGEDALATLIKTLVE